MLDDMKLLKLLAILGLILSLLGLIFIFAPPTQEEYIPYFDILAAKTVEVSPISGYSEFLKCEVLIFF